MRNHIYLQLDQALGRGIDHLEVIVIVEGGEEVGSRVGSHLDSKIGVMELEVGMIAHRVHHEVIVGTEEIEDIQETEEIEVIKGTEEIGI